MSLSRRLRNIAKTQINALKEKLDRVDANEDAEEFDKQSAERAERELNDPTDLRLARRTPEEIARGRSVSRAPAAQMAPANQVASTASLHGASTVNPLAVHYRILGVEEGSDLNSIEAAY